MHHPARVPFRIGLYALTVAFPLLAAAPARAQQLPAGETPDRFSASVRKAENLVRELLGGAKKLDEPAYQEALDLRAKWYAFRVTWSDSQTKSGEMNGLV